MRFHFDATTSRIALLCGTEVIGIMHVCDFVELFGREEYKSVLRGGWAR